MELAGEIKHNLLKLVRKTIEEKLFGKSEITVNLSYPELNEISGAFVTLHKRGTLRGCIGNIIGIMPLKETIKEMSLAAAFGDPRFPSLTVKEYPDIEIEITVLSCLKEVSVNEIEPFKHGVVLSRGYQKSTYLPQVWEQLPDKEQFLSSLCQKCGMEKTGWCDPNTKIEVYTGLVFSEKDFQ